MSNLTIGLARLGKRIVVDITILYDEADSSTDVVVHIGSEDLDFSYARPMTLFLREHERSLHSSGDQWHSPEQIYVIVESVMSDAKTTTPIRIRRGEINGGISLHFYNELMKAVNESLVSKEPSPGGRRPVNRPVTMPEGSIFLFAETESASGSTVPIGSVAAYPLVAGTPGFEKLPSRLDKAAEMKRVFVDAEFRRRGLASKLIEAIEDVARAEMGVEYMVVETMGWVDDGKKLYLGAGYRPRGVYGTYGEEDSVCLEKWL